jgi:hypothetical protein
MAAWDDVESGDPLGSRGLEREEERVTAVAPAVASLRRRLLALRDAVPASAEPPPSSVGPAHSEPPTGNPPA